MKRTTQQQVETRVITELTAKAVRLELELARELDRLGVSEQDLGPVDCILVDVSDDGQTVRIYDDGKEDSLPAAALLSALRTLPDGAGWEATWEAVLDTAGENEKEGAEPIPPPSISQ